MQGQKCLIDNIERVDGYILKKQKQGVCHNAAFAILH
jgi:hypothetical protein